MDASDSTPRRACCAWRSGYRRWCGRTRSTNTHRPSCLYIPVDCVLDLSVFYDFNEYDPTPRLTGNVAVMSGFLEYTNNPRSAIITVLRWAPRLLLSHAPSVGDDVQSREAEWVDEPLHGGAARILPRIRRCPSSDSGHVGRADHVRGETMISSTTTSRSSCHRRPCRPIRRSA